MAGNRSGALKGWDVRRANASAIESARAKSPGKGVPPGAGRVQSTRDGAIVWAAPRSPDGRVEPQVALGGGSVSKDMVTRAGAHVSRKGVRSGLENVQGLRTVTVTYHVSDADDSEESRKRTTHRVTVDFGRYTTERQRELAIARVVQDHARSLRYTRDGVSQVVAVSLVRVGDPVQLRESRKAVRHDRKRPKAKAKAKPKTSKPKPRRHK